VKYKYVSLIAGFIVGSFVVYGLNKFMLTDACLDSGGAINKVTGACISNHTDEEFYIVLSWSVILIYLLAGIVSTVITALLLNKILVIIDGGSEKT